MKAVRKRPGEAPEIVEIENTLEALQAEVGGLIESLQIATDCTLLVNEEGKLQGLKPNMWFCGDILVGTILAVGVKGEDFCSLSDRNAAVLCSWLTPREDGL